jgi:gliding motility-associated-like protein
MNNYVTVDNYPIASFLTSSNKFTELIQLLEFTNTSSGAASYTWDFGDGASSTEINPEHNFTDNLYGHVITLTAYSQFLCESTATIEILFNNSLIYYIPNTFTPNGDEFNQIFKPIFSNNSIDVYNYSFYIYNRWEHVIFETHDVEKGWDGLFEEDGIPVPQGTYNYKIIVKFKETDERKEFFGHINLVR